MSSDEQHHQDSQIQQGYQWCDERSVSWMQGVPLTVCIQPCVLLVTVVVLQPVALAAPAPAQSELFLVELKSFTQRNPVRQRVCRCSATLTAEMWPVLRLANATGGMRIMHFAMLASPCLCFCDAATLYPVVQNQVHV